MVNTESLKPKVSIGMPVYNGEHLLRQALDSLLGQTFTEFELIISDNASTDKTQIICEEYVVKDDRIRYVRQDRNQGAAENFQIVFNLSRGKYFMWAAHDDTWDENFIKNNYDHLELNEDIGLTFCWFNLVDVNSREIIKTIQPNTNLHDNKAYNYIINLFSINVHKIYGIYRREMLWQAIKIYPTSDFYDVFLTSYFSVKSKISIIPSVHFYYGEDVYKLRTSISRKKIFKFDYANYYRYNIKLLNSANFGFLLKLICLSVFNLHFIKLFINGEIISLLSLEKMNNK